MPVPPFVGAVRRILWLPLLASVALAQSALPPEPVSCDSWAAFKAPGSNWKIAAEVAGDPRHDKALAAQEGTGVLICNPGSDKPARTHLFTAWEHGDLELDLDFLLTPGSNSGVYLQGRYEVQLFDSWGKRDVTSGDCGGIYHRWDPKRGAGQEGYDGTAPRANACRAPGLWQHLHIEFQAPRFDAAGKKTRNARFAKVVLNGFLIHEDVEVTGPTRSAAFNDEKPLGPLMIQGDHGPVALRRLAVKRFGLESIAVTDLHYKLYTGDLKGIGSYDNATPKSEGVPERFSHSAVEKSGKFALVFTGKLNAPRAGAYRFAVESFDASRLLIDGKPVVTALDRGSQPGIVTLTAGPHEFRWDVLHNSNSRPNLELIAEGPGIAPRALTVRERTEGRGGRGARPASSKKAILVEPKDRVLLQRGFVPFEPRKRLYAASVGSPAGVHYAYDFETAAVLRVWRGSFVNATEMWEGRGEPQLARPDGPALTLNGKPTVALIEYAANGDWPDGPDPLWSSAGYTLESDGQPVFRAKLAELAITDRIAALADGHGLVRRLDFKGSVPSWSTWVLLAEADQITAQPDGHGWIIGDREWYLDWPAGVRQRAVIRTVNGKCELAVPLSNASLTQPVSYSIIW